MITDDELLIAYNNPDNQAIIKTVCFKYSNSLQPEILKSCGLIAVWRCLQSHDSSFGQKFTSSLYRFVNWECLKELDAHKKLPMSPQVENFYEEDGFNEYLDMVSPQYRPLLHERFREGRTFTEIGDARGYSRQAAEQNISRGIEELREILDVCGV